MPLPLEGIRVLDLSRVLAGPYCTMQLADLGADVWKVERPQVGDDTRGWGPPFAGGESAYFLCCNRNKRSLTIDLKQSAGRELVARLAGVCDVLVENFLPGTMASWGLDADTLRSRHPGLIYCSISGFGQTGPRRMEPGYDIMIQAQAGVMSITGEPDGPPTKLGVAIADITAGLFASQAILAALVGRARTGLGEQIDIALFDSTVAWLANVGENYLLSGEVPQRLGSQHPNIVPYQVFATADGNVVIGVGNDSQFRRFCQLLAVPEWADDPRFATNGERVRHRQELIPLVAARVKMRSSADWLRDLDRGGIPCGEVRQLQQVFADPQVSARDMLCELDHPTIGRLVLAGSPFHFGSDSNSVRNLGTWRAPPLLGEHTREVLRETLGLAESVLADLAHREVIGPEPRPPADCET
ncbi:MAG: CaiB/BaiF CoA transferase family protein [Planctomycetaceae bacterium]